MRFSHACAAAVLAAVSLCTATATASDFEVGAAIGGNYNRLSQPRDLEGEPTLLQGSRFTGFGVHVGADGRWRAAKLDFADLVVDASLLLAFQNGSGFVEDSASGARRDVDLSLVNLRVPITVGARYTLTDAIGLTLELGPELLLGLASSSTVTESGLPGEPTPLAVTTATSVGLSIGAELDVRIGDSLIVPIGLRYVNDPLVPKKTTDRFDGFENEDNPGAYTVAFDHVVLFTIGARFGL
jgi:hypothetical protein